jgi:hypothetical protein
LLDDSTCELTDFQRARRDIKRDTCFQKWESATILLKYEQHKVLRAFIALDN